MRLYPHGVWLEWCLLHTVESVLAPLLCMLWLSAAWIAECHPSMGFHACCGVPFGSLDATGLWIPGWLWDLHGSWLFCPALLVCLWKCVPWLLQAWVWLASISWCPVAAICSSWLAMIRCLILLVCCKVLFRLASLYPCYGSQQPGWGSLPSLFGLLMVWLADAWPLVLVLGLCFDGLFLLRLLLKWFWLVAVLRVEADDGFSLLAWCSVFCLLGRNPLGWGSLPKDMVLLHVAVLSSGFAS